MVCTYLMLKIVPVLQQIVVEFDLKLPEVSVWVILVAEFVASCYRIQRHFVQKLSTIFPFAAQSLWSHQSMAVAGCGRGFLGRFLGRFQA